MADSASEVDLESDASSIDGSSIMKVTSPSQLEQLQKRIDSLYQENKVLKVELETYKLRCNSIQEENRELRRTSVTIQARAEQEEEYISNKLLKKIQDLKKDKEKLVMNYEREEEYLTNDLSRKMMLLQQEKVQLEKTLEREQEYQVNKLMRKIDKLEAETKSKQNTLDQLRREKVELENSLEQEQEALVNRLWVRMDKLEAEKRVLQEKLEEPVSSPPSPLDINNGDTPANLTQHIENLRKEVLRLRGLLSASQNEHVQKMEHYAQEERHTREENVRLQRKLQLEIERREALCRHLSESESSLEMDDERHFNEMTKTRDLYHPVTHGARQRTVSSPIPMMQSPVGSSNSSRPLSPGKETTGHSYPTPALSPPSPMRGLVVGTSNSNSGSSSSANFLSGSSPPKFPHVSSPRSNTERFVKPTTPKNM